MVTYYRLDERLTYSFPTLDPVHENGMKEMAMNATPELTNIIWDVTARRDYITRDPPYRPQH